MALTDPVGSGRRGDGRQRDLARTKLLATGLLAATFALLVVARIFEHAHPAMGFVVAFAEAATVGGLADWYAVVALFRRPLGLPIPHTAIIPRNQQRIGDSLGTFIETHFLAPGPVAAKLKEVDFARLASDWLRDPLHSASLARFVLRLLPRAFAAMDESGLRPFLARRFVERIEQVEITPLAAGILGTLTQERRHQRILDELMVAAGRLLDNPEALAAIRDRIRDELPSLFNLFRADAYVLRKLVGAIAALLEEVRVDPEHAVRREFDQFIASFIERLRTSPEYAERLERLKRDLLARPELRSLADDVWQSLQSFLDQETRAPESVIHGHLRNLLVDIGEHLQEDARIRADINAGMVTVLQTFVETEKSGISKFISDQVKSWDMDQMIRLIELNIGRDLQYIRFNGTLIGGLAGLALHGGEKLLRLA
jgi:uncharacterized membrane-anchored protein YjiN (DUF445 family)